MNESVYNKGEIADLQSVVVWPLRTNHVVCLVSILFGKHIVCSSQVGDQPGVTARKEHGLGQGPPSLSYIHKKCQYDRLDMKCLRRQFQSQNSMPLISSSCRNPWD